VPPHFLHWWSIFCFGIVTENIRQRRQHFLISNRSKDLRRSGRSTGLRRTM
ncbi:unnamed protein product, partial [Leptidea sinapis]